MVLAPRTRLRKSPLLVVLSLLAACSREDATRVTPAGLAARGAALYQQSCAACHGAQGEGRVRGNATALNNQDFLVIASDEFLRRTVALGRAGTEMPAWGREAGGQLRPQAIADLVAFLRSWQRAPTRPARARASHGSPARGAEMYLANCANCHGPEGKGNLGMGPALNSPDLLAAASDGFLWETIARGREGTPMFPSLRGLDGVRQLSERDVDDLVAFIRSWDRAGRGPARASR